MTAYLKLRSKVPASSAGVASPRLLSVFMAFAPVQNSFTQTPAQGFEPVGEARLDRAERNSQHVGRLFERHLVQVVEDDDGAAGRRESRDRLVEPCRQDGRELLARGRRGQSLQRLLVPNLLGPAPLALHVSESLAGRNPVGPGAEQARLAQPAELAVDAYERLLKDVLGELPLPDEAQEVAVKWLLHRREQRVERLAVAR